MEINILSKKKCKIFSYNIIRQSRDKPSNYQHFLELTVNFRSNKISNLMDPTFVQNFRDYIDLSTSDLQTTLNAIIMHETLQYDVIYEKFLKAIENYKISMLNQMKSQLFPGDLATERQKEHIMLQQMKNLVTIKIKTYSLFIFLLSLIEK